MAKDTSKPFNTRRTSVEASGTRNEKAALAKGGRNKDVGEQNADTGTPGITGHKTAAKGAGKISALGGPGLKGNKSKIGQAAPAVEGRTGNAAGSKNRQGYDWSKEGFVRLK